MADNQQQERKAFEKIARRKGLDLQRERNGGYWTSTTYAVYVGGENRPTASRLFPPTPSASLDGEVVERVADALAESEAMYGPDYKKQAIRAISAMPAWKGVDGVKRHVGNPKLIRIDGLKIIAMPECEGGGYAITGHIAERIVNLLSTPLSALPLEDEAVEIMAKKMKSAELSDEIYAPDKNLHPMQTYRLLARRAYRALSASAVPEKGE